MAEGEPLGSVPSRAGPDETDLARAEEYALLARLLAAAPDRDLLAGLARLPGGDDTPLGRAHAGVAAAAAASDPGAVEREHFDLFIGLGRGELLPYASYYLTGFLHERPLARVREDLARLGLERGEASEPEDHVALLFEVMAGLAEGRFEAPEAEQARFFARHLQPWAGKFFADLEAAGSARFYRTVATYGRTFLDIEAEAFTIER